MKFNTFLRSAAVLTITLCTAFTGYARTTSLIAISADVVEISGSLQTSKGFTWNEVFDFSEKAIEGIFTVGEFQRLTGLFTTLKLLEEEGKAQILSNPKVLTKSGTQAQIVVGGEIPYPATNSQGVSAEFKKFGIILNVLPVILREKGNIIDVQIELEVSGPDFSKTINIAGNPVPQISTRRISNEVEMRSGETLVIGGLKSSSRNVSIRRVPFFGRIPIIGNLFKFKAVVEEQRSLFLFITVEVVK